MNWNLPLLSHSLCNCIAPCFWARAELQASPSPPTQHHQGRTAPPHMALTIMQTCWSREKDAVSMSVCGLQAEHERPLEMQVPKDKETWYLTGHMGFVKSNLWEINSNPKTGASGRNQRTGSDVVCEEKGHTKDGVQFGGFWQRQTQWNSKGKTQFPGQAKANYIFFSLLLTWSAVWRFLAWMRSNRKLLMVSLISGEDFSKDRRSKGVV